MIANLAYREPLSLIFLGLMKDASRGTQEHSLLLSSQQLL